MHAISKGRFAVLVINSVAGEEKMSAIFGPGGVSAKELTSKKEAKRKASELLQRHPLNAYAVVEVTEVMITRTVATSRVAA